MQINPLSGVQNQIVASNGFHENKNASKTVTVNERRMFLVYNWKGEDHLGLEAH